MVMVYFVFCVYILNVFIEMSFSQTISSPYISFNCYDV